MQKMPLARIYTILLLACVIPVTLEYIAHARQGISITIFIPESHTAAGIPALEKNTAAILMGLLDKQEALSAHIAEVAADNKSGPGLTLSEKCAVARRRGSSHFITGSITQDREGLRYDLFLINAHNSKDARHFFIQRYTPQAMETQLQPVAEKINALLHGYEEAPPQTSAARKNGDDLRPEAATEPHSCFIIHAGSYRNRENAQEEAARFRKEGVDASVQRIALGEGEDIWFRVYVGSFPERRKAQNIQLLLEKKYSAQTRLLPCR